MLRCRAASCRLPLPDALSCAEAGSKTVQTRHDCQSLAGPLLLGQSPFHLLRCCKHVACRLCSGCAARHLYHALAQGCAAAVSCTEKSGEWLRASMAATAGRHDSFYPLFWLLVLLKCTWHEVCKPLCWTEQVPDVLASTSLVCRHGQGDCIKESAGCWQMRPEHGLFMAAAGLHQRAVACLARSQTR